MFPAPGASAPHWDVSHSKPRTQEALQQPGDEWLLTLAVKEEPSVSLNQLPNPKCTEQRVPFGEMGESKTTTKINYNWQHFPTTQASMGPMTSENIP